MNGELVTRRDLAEAVTALQGGMSAMKTELRGEMSAMGAELRGEMSAMGAELRGEISAMGAELRGEMSAMKTELRDEMATMGAELRGEISAMGAELRGEMSAMKTALIREIGVATSHVANVMVDEVRRLVSVVEEKYQDLPPEQAKLRKDFDAHAADLRLHHRAPVPLPRRARRSRTR